MLINILLLIFGRYDYRFDNDFDGPAPSPLWLNLIVIFFIFVGVWWNRSQRIQNHFGKNSTISSRSDLLFIVKALLLDIKDCPLNLFACIGIVVIYILLKMYSWLFYIFLGLGFIGYILYTKGKNKENEEPEAGKSEEE